MGSYQRLAVVGGGISGISCLWTLRDSPCEVHLFEADERLGGHANSVPFTGEGHTVRVDTGFIAMNNKSYPQFSQFLDALKVQRIPTDMSFGVSEDHGAFEWGSLGLSSFLGSWWNLLSPWYWRLIFDILRFNFFAMDILSEDEIPDRKDSSLESIGQYLMRKGYSEQFKRYFIIPMVAAPWCISPNEFSRDFPAKFLIRFMAEHRLLNTVTETLRWQTIKDGSRSYVEAFQKTIPKQQHIHLRSPVAAVRRQEDGQVSVAFTDQTVQHFDHVVLAVHANQAVTLLGQSISQQEYDILTNFKTSRNVCVLHSDIDLLPKRPNAQVSWNCLIRSRAADIKASQEKRKICSEVGAYKHATNPEAISITFDMNRLQAVPSPGQANSPGKVLVSMNPLQSPRDAQRTDTYYHPLFNSSSVRASERLWEINGVSGISYAGAWMGYGFHEDGFAAGARAAKQILGAGKSLQATRLAEVDCPWTLKQTHGTRLIRSAIEIIQLIIESIVCKPEYG